MINEEQMITGYPIDGAIGSSGGGRVRKLSLVCLHNNAMFARGILVTIYYIAGHPSHASVPSILLVLLEPHFLQYHFFAIRHNLSSVGCEFLQLLESKHLNRRITHTTQYGYDIGVVRSLQAKIVQCEACSTQ